MSKISLELINPLVQHFAEHFSTAESPLLKEINDYTSKHHEDPIMLSGHLQGKLLEMISWMIRPKRVLEIGTFTGYSALCLASGLTEDGELHSIEIREKDALLAKSFFARSSFASKIYVHTGDAREIIPRLNQTWDLVFIDADKPSYIEYFNLVFARLRKNGFILADNIFFHGQVLGKEKEEVKGKSARGILDFNAFIQERTDIEKLVLTIRDGLYLIRKL